MTAAAPARPGAAVPKKTVAKAPPPDEPNKTRTMRLSDADYAMLNEVNAAFDLKSNAVAVALVFGQLGAAFSRCDAAPPLSPAQLKLLKAALGKSEFDLANHPVRQPLNKFLAFQVEAVADGAADVSALAAAVESLTPVEALWAVKRAGGR